MAARLAIARAQRQLSEEADVHLHVRNFEVRLLVHHALMMSARAQHATLRASPSHPWTFAAVLRRRR